MTKTIRAAFVNEHAYAAVVNCFECGFHTDRRFWFRRLASKRALGGVDDMLVSADAATIAWLRGGDSWRCTSAFVPRWVYIAATPSGVKVGSTGALRERMVAVRSSDLLGLWLGNEATERSLHAELAPWRLRKHKRSEYFQDCDEIRLIATHWESIYPIGEYRGCCPWALAEARASR